MENIKKIFERIKKSPKTMPIKGYRFFKKKVFSKLPQREINLTGVTINEKHILTNTIIDDFRDIEVADAMLYLKKYNILGKIYTLEKINWHLGFESEQEKQWADVVYDREGDKKIPWELSKCQHFIDFALAYRKTKEKEYFEEYKKQFVSWVQENPYQKGINWVTPMECAIRAVNWIEAYHIFKEEYDEDLKSILIKQLYLHGKHIYENMEWSPVKENHYLSDCMGLFFIGTALENCKEAEKWKSFAKRELEKEIIKQVSEDGVDDEGSVNYHRLVTEILLLCYILGEKTRNTFSESYKERLENMCNFIMYYTTPLGKVPSFGDTDNGRVLHIWDPDINDHRDILSIASVLFKRGDFKAKGKFHQKMLLLISKEEYNAIQAEDKELQSKAFTDWDIIRDKDFFIMIHCGGIGRKDFGGHGHNDQLSFVLSTSKGDYIIDPGTYCYTSEKKKRHEFRSTVAHNSVVLNKQEQNGIEEESPFDMEHKTKSICFQWQSDKHQDIFIGKHFGYAPNILTREIHYEKRKKEITITERTKEDADMELNFTLDPSVEIKQEGQKVILNKEVEIECEETPLIETTAYSREYGHISQTKKITIKKTGNNLITTIRLLREPIKIVTSTPKEEEKAIPKKKEGKVSKEDQYY